MKKPTRFLTNEKGEKIAVVIEMREYEKLLDQTTSASILPSS